MKNQFNSRTPTKVIDVILQRSSHAQAIFEASAKMVKNPDDCLVPEGINKVFMRVEGRKYNVALRSVFYYLAYGKLPVLGPSTCGTAGCVNPEHQAPVVAVSFKTHAAE